MADLKDLFSRNEHMEIEAIPASASLPGAFWTAYSALANASGGVIVLGAEVDQSAGRLRVGGIAEPNLVLADLYEGLEKGKKVSANLLFTSRINQIEYENAQLIIVEIPKADRYSRPVCAGTDLYSGCYLRDRGRNRLCTREEIQTMIRERNSAADRSLLTQLNLHVLDQASVERYRHIFQARYKTHPWTGMGTEEFLVKLGAAGRGSGWNMHPTVAGLLFFGEREVLRQVFPKYVLDYREILASGAGWAKHISSRDPDWSGNVFDFYCRTIDNITGGVPSPGWNDTIGEKAYRAQIGNSAAEVFANALIHADYNGGGGIVADQGVGWIRIANPGSFLVDVREAKAGAACECRNKTLAGFFFRIGVGTGLGEGLSHVIRIFKKYGLNEPEILEYRTMNRVTVTLNLLPGREEDLEAKNKSKEYGVTDSSLQEGGSGSLNSCFSAPPPCLRKTDERVLGIIAKDQEITGKAIAMELAVSLSTVKRSIRRLKELGLLIRQGEGRGRWQVKQGMPPCAIPESIV